MFKSLAFVVAAGLVFFVGCDRKSADPVAQAISKIPTKAPDVSKGPGTVFEHLQYAMVRKDPKHLELFMPDNTDHALGAIIQYNFDAGWYGLLLTPDEISTLGVQELLEKGYISDTFTYRAVDDYMNGKRDTIEAGVEKYANSFFKLDMAVGRAGFQMEKKALDAQQKQLRETLEKNLRASYTAGLYRLLKAVPEEGWGLITATIGSNPDKSMNDLILRAGDEEVCTLVVGKNSDGAMFIWTIKFSKSPTTLAKMFHKTPEPGK